ncbi:hypothetical protein HGRIS_013598 [Hohenbuehelia grisea]|uniref:Cytokinin riboside 5'-monophosphate phosphoribohydrolase n=1 Tax=Hohenbuehelia grisea TaxID=104357 RepID=A0ABR3IW14_9AGAR
MHERKVEMAKRSCAFIGLPGGFGTFEEVLEVTTWTQLGIHTKPVVLINVLSYWEPLRQLIQGGVREGFISQANADIIVFVDGPGAGASAEEHETFNWGEAALNAITAWTHETSYRFKWTDSETAASSSANDSAKLNFA